MLHILFPVLRIGILYQLSYKFFNTFSGFHFPYLQLKSLCLPSLYQYRHLLNICYASQKIKCVNSINEKRNSITNSICELAGTRTQGPYIKSVLLYQLSYQFITRFLITECKNKAKTSCSKSFSKSFLY